MRTGKSHIVYSYVVLINKYGQIKITTAPTAPEQVLSKQEKDSLLKLSEGSFNLAVIFIHVPNKALAECKVTHTEYFIQDTSLKNIKSKPQSILQQEILTLTAKEMNLIKNFNPFIEQILFH